MRGALRRGLTLALDALRRPARTAESIETIALLAAAAALAIGFAISILLFWGSSLSISGPGSIGAHAAVGGAIVTVVAFVLGRVAVREVPTASDRRPAVERLRWYDLIAIAASYAAVALLGWSGVAELIELSFIGAPVFAFPGAVLVGVAYALTAYVAFLASARLTPLSLSMDLAVFLVVGAFAAMLTSNDPHWWRRNLSALGMTTNTAAPAFNVTLLIAGVIITTIARFATAGLPVERSAQRRGRSIMRIGLVLVGLLLAAVGVFPVDRFFLLHNTVATGMVVAFAAMICALPWLLPTLPRVFLVLGYVFVAVIALLGVFFATGYYNLTAVELIAAVLIFAWIIVFLRTTATATARPTRAPATDADVRIARHPF